VVPASRGYTATLHRHRGGSHGKICVHFGTNTGIRCKIWDPHCVSPGNFTRSAVEYGYGMV